MLEEHRNLVPALPTRKSRNHFLVFEQNRLGNGEFQVPRQKSVFDVSEVTPIAEKRKQRVRVETDPHE